MASADSLYIYFASESIEASGVKKGASGKRTRKSEIAFRLPSCTIQTLWVWSMKRR